MLRSCAYPDLHMEATCCVIVMLESNMIPRLLVHAGCQKFAVVLGDFSVPNFLEWLPQDFSARCLLICHLIISNSPRILDWVDIWAVFGPFQYADVVFLGEVSDYL